MDTRLTDDERFFQKSIRDFLTASCTPEVVRAAQEPGAPGMPEPLWRALADSGWIGMAFPEAYGGGGSSLFELGLFCQEAGRVLLPTPFVSSVLAGMLVFDMGTEHQREQLLPSLITGEASASIAVTELNAMHDLRYLECRMTRVLDGWEVSGQKAFIENAASADVLLVACRTDMSTSRGISVVSLPAGAEGVYFIEHQTFGGDRQQRVVLDKVRFTDDEVLGGPAAVGSAEPALVRLNRIAVVLQCMEVAGGARRMVEMTADYVREREQFGVPIGSFQAVQHHLADMTIAVVGAELSALQAAWLVSESLPANRAVAVAKACASSAYKTVSLLAHQLHGGMGYVKESDLYLWSQRAKSTEVRYGSRDFHLNAMAEAVGI